MTKQFVPSRVFYEPEALKYPLGVDLSRGFPKKGDISIAEGGLPEAPISSRTSERLSRSFEVPIKARCRGGSN